MSINFIPATRNPSTVILEDILKLADYKVFHTVAHTSRSGLTVYVKLLCVNMVGSGAMNISRLVAELMDLQFDEEHKSVVLIDWGQPGTMGKRLVYAVGDKLSLTLQQQKV